MFQFAYPFFLWGLIAIPIMWFIFLSRMRWKRRAVKKFGDPTLVYRLAPDFSPGKLRVRFFLLVAGWIFLIVGLSNPRIGSKYEEVKRQGIDMIIALDVSKSMLAEDLRPNRLERAKQAVTKLLDKFGDDRIGIVVFAGEASLQLPFTSDYAAARMFLSTISTESIQTQGTAIGRAIQISVRSLPRDKSRSKAIIIITDGENHEDDAIEQASTAKSAGINVYTLGIGSVQGAPIPEMKDGRLAGYKKDESGSTVITRMNPEMLKEVAQAGGGLFVQSNSGNVGLEDLFTQINALQKTDYGTKTFTDYEDRFQYFLLPALLILLIELWVNDKRSALSKRVNLFNTKKR
ncbi:MAG: VWA domain-containing protein [Bacteroidia bacterium]